MSQAFDSIGEGGFASRDIAANTVISLYSGMMLSEEENLKQKMEMVNKVKNNIWQADDPEIKNLWSTKHKLSGCDKVIDVPPEFAETSRYQGSLGHKCNHKFDVPPQISYEKLETPRYLHHFLIG